MSPIAGSEIRPGCVLHRVLRLDYTAFTLNSRVYEPLAVRIARSHPITTIQSPITVGSSRAFGSQKLTGAPSADSSKRQPEVAMNWIQDHVNMA